MAKELTQAKRSTVRKAELTPKDVMDQVKLIEQVRNDAMKNGIHYGIIPGCGDKPTLLKPGAEKLCLVFRLAPSYTCEKNDLEGGHREYEYVCTLTHIQTGLKWGEGVGICSSMESKYRYRNAARKCPACNAEAIIKGKAEYGGGWLCWKKKDGCGAKFQDGDQAIEGQESGKMENPNPADTFNTVKKIGKKRAFVDACLTATAASDSFTQDIEEIKQNERAAGGAVDAEFTVDQSGGIQSGAGITSDSLKTLCGSFRRVCTNLKAKADTKTLLEYCAAYVKDATLGKLEELTESQASEIVEIFDNNPDDLKAFMAGRKS